MSDDQIVVTKTVDVSPSALFDVLATPAKHVDNDGSGMLKGVDSGPAKVSKVGDEFIIDMNNDALGDYQMKNTVTSFEQDRKIGWGPSIHPFDAYTDKIGEAKATGHTFTWELEPEGSGTKVTQTYDWSGVQDPNFRGFFPLLNEQQLTDAIDKTAQAAK